MNILIWTMSDFELKGHVVWFSNQTHDFTQKLYNTKIN